MTIIEEVIKNNTLKRPKNEIVQEFVVRVKITTDETDAKVIRDALDNVESVLRTASYRFDIVEQHVGKAEVVQVYPK